MSETNGNAAQVRVIAESVAEATILRFTQDHPEYKKQPPEPAVPAPLKWAAGIIAALFTMSIGGMALWLVTTVNQMQLTMTRIDERITNSVEARFAEYDRRIGELESERNGS